MPTLGGAKFFLCANISVGANVSVTAKVFGCANVFVSAKVFGCANVFCVYFSTPIFLCIFLHSYLVCANNLIGANVFEVFRLKLIIVAMIMYCVFQDYY